MSNIRYTLSQHPQGTPEWHADRLGRLTGSNAGAILVKKADSVMRRNYRTQLALERITGKSQEAWGGNKHTERGNEKEPLARMAYEDARDCMIEEAGFAGLRTLMAGCSVDGFAAARQGLIEVKCPIPAIHWDYLDLKEPPKEYMPQITHNMWVTGAKFVDFISFNDDMEEELRLHIIRVERDEAAITAYEIEALVFLAEVDKLVIDMRARAKKKRAA